jgi:hypothetical protein
VGLGIYAAHTLDGLSITESAEIRKYLLRSERLLGAQRLLTLAAGPAQEYLLDRDASALSGHRERAKNSWSQAM